MICQECGINPATLHFTKIINEEKTEFHICEACAREKGEVIPGTTNGFSIHNLLSGLLNFEPTNTNSTVSSKTENLKCDHCGLTYSQFGKLGRFGCSHCYKHFADRLDHILKRVHGNTVHVGKVPKRSGGQIQYKREIDQLKQTLTKKINKEEFEEAAKLRDQIKELERKLGS